MAKIDLPQEGKYAELKALMHELLNDGTLRSLLSNFGKKGLKADFRGALDGKPIDAEQRDQLEGLLDFLAGVVNNNASRTNLIQEKVNELGLNFDNIDEAQYDEMVRVFTDNQYKTAAEVYSAHISLTGTYPELFHISDYLPSLKAIEAYCNKKYRNWNEA
jgi:hypothetical protein